MLNYNEPLFIEGELNMLKTLHKVLEMNYRNLESELIIQKARNKHYVEQMHIETLKRNRVENELIILKTQLLKTLLK